jgi:hypothetical protein
VETIRRDGSVSGHASFYPSAEVFRASQGFQAALPTAGRYA